MVVGGLTVVSGRFGGAPGSSGQRWLGCVWLWSGVGGLVTVWWRSGGGVVCWFGGGLVVVQWWSGGLVVWWFGCVLGI